jgi:hypothetical protein
MTTIAATSGLGETDFISFVLNFELLELEAVNSETKFFSQDMKIVI